MGKYNKNSNNNQNNTKNKKNRQNKNNRIKSTIVITVISKSNKRRPLMNWLPRPS